MRYISTRGKAPELGFEDVLLSGLANDGGLYIPKEWPKLDFKVFLQPLILNRLHIYLILLLVNF